MSGERSMKKSLPEKEFKVRDAPLKDVLNNEYFNIAYRFGIVAAFVLGLSNALNDIYFGGTSEFGFKLIRLSFENFDRTFSLWLATWFSHFLVYVGWNVWRILRPKQSYLWDRLWIFSFLVHLFGSFGFTVILMTEVPIAFRYLLLIEMTRLLMKNIAFVRTNSYEYLVKVKRFEIPTISKFIYFSFAPTLIYKNEYPRWPTRNWNTIGKMIIQMVFITYTLSLIEETYVIRALRDFGKHPFTNLQIFVIIIDKMIPSFIAYTLVATVILYSAQYLFAELLQFGDREFQKDWWNSKTASEFHLKWNKLVRDWLFYYVYRDFYEYITPKNKYAARVAVYILSWVLHEVIFICTVGLVCPIFLFLMSCSMLVTFSKTAEDIVFAFPLLPVITGEALQFIVPHLEYYAKENCPETGDNTMYISKLYTCYNNIQNT